MKKQLVNAELQLILKTVRKECVKYVRKIRFDKENGKEYARFYDYGCSDLHCFCAPASIILYSLLKKYNYKPKLCKTPVHIFVVLDDVVLDVTASQFGKPAVYIEELSTVLDDKSISGVYDHYHAFKPRGYRHCLNTLIKCSWRPTQLITENTLKELIETCQNKLKYHHPVYQSVN